MYTDEREIVVSCTLMRIAVSLGLFSINACCFQEMDNEDDKMLF